MQQIELQGERARSAALKIISSNCRHMDFLEGIVSCSLLLKAKKLILYSNKEQSNTYN
jgi:hypothetical protein